MMFDEVASGSNQPKLWVTESDPDCSLLSAVVSLSMGILLGVGYGVAEGDGYLGSVAATFGVMLVVVGLGLLFFGGKEVVTVDCESRTIRIEVVGGGLGRKTVVGFGEIKSVALSEAFAGDEDAGRYFVQLLLHDGRHVNLFFGAYRGAFSRFEMQRRCARLRACLKTDVAAAP